MTADMLTGVNVDPAEYDTRLARAPRAAVCRVFGPPGAGIPGWRDPRIVALHARGIIPHVSFRDWPTDMSAVDAVTAWLDAAPPAVDGHSAWLTWMHEPEPKGYASATYRRRWLHLAAAVNRHRNADRIRLVPIQTLQWTASSQVGKGGGDASLYYTGVGHVGMDCYADSWAATYPPPAKFLDLPLRLADAAGQPITIPELGAARLPTDPTGARRAEWIRAVAALLRAKGCAAVSWWDDLGTGGVDFRLDDAPSRAAWSDVLAGRV